MRISVGIKARKPAAAVSSRAITPRVPRFMLPPRLLSPTTVDQVMAEERAASFAKRSIKAGAKLAGLNLDWPYINNLEFVGRYDTVRDGLGTWVDRYTIGYVYYFSNTLLFEGDYEFLSSNDPEQAHNAFVFQLSYGF